MAIVSFKDLDAEKLFEDGVIPRKAGWHSVVKKVEVKLDMLEAATELDDLRSPPGNRLEALKHDRKGQHSIRVNSQWRICFVWKGGNAHNVEVVDYH